MHSLYTVVVYLTDALGARLFAVRCHESAVCIAVSQTFPVIAARLDILAGGVAVAGAEVHVGGTRVV